WGPSGQGSPRLKVGVDLNVPYRVVSQGPGKGTFFKDPHQYWHFLYGDGSWEWHASPEESREGNPFYQLFLPNLKRGKNRYSMPIQGAAPGPSRGRPAPGKNPAPAPPPLPEVSAMTGTASVEQERLVVYWESRMPDEVGVLQL